jgi:hypothetical protein
MTLRSEQMLKPRSFESGFGSVGENHQESLHVVLVLMRPVRQADSPELVLWVQSFDTGLHFGRGELANPGDAKLRFFRAALQRHHRSHFQLLPQSAKPGTAGRDVYRMREVSILVDQNLHRQHHFFPQRFPIFQHANDYRAPAGKTKLTTVITAQYRDCISRTLLRGIFRMFVRNAGDLSSVTGVTCRRQGSGS